MGIGNAIRNLFNKNNESILYVPKTMISTDSSAKLGFNECPECAAPYNGSVSDLDKKKLEKGIPITNCEFCGTVYEIFSQDSGIGTKTVDAGNPKAIESIRYVMETMSSEQTLKLAQVQAGLESKLLGLEGTMHQGFSTVNGKLDVIGEKVETQYDTIMKMLQNYSQETKNETSNVTKPSFNKKASAFVVDTIMNWIEQNKDKYQTKSDPLFTNKIQGFLENLEHKFERAIKHSTTNIPGLRAELKEITNPGRIIKHDGENIFLYITKNGDTIKTGFEDMPGQECKYITSINPTHQSFNPTLMMESTGNIFNQCVVKLKSMEPGIAVFKPKIKLNNYTSEVIPKNMVLVINEPWKMIDGLTSI